MATIKDVAKHADLSVATVSRYLNNHPYISEEKRKRIKNAMEELDYTPSLVATQLRSKKGTMIGILVSRITNPFFSYLVDSIEKQAKSNGYTILIMQTYDDQDAEAKMLELLKQQVISGLIMCSIETDSQTIELYREYGPIVLCNVPLPDSDIPQIVTDQEQATYEAVNYLIDSGYKKIAYCTGGNLTASGHGSARTKGFERALVTANLITKKEWVFKQVHSIDDGKLVAEKILQLPKDLQPDAIFTSSDLVASGIIEVMTKHQKKVPDFLAVMGFDNQPFSSLLSIPLTTIAQPVEALGVESTNLMISLLEGKSYHVDQSKLILQLIKRESA
ncbi:LacI family DNA-binding transcriptional regulator [Desemzia sp. RIT804]|uniref:LacI family DNA-binding transcriptional regulator n=1 Tax=Desemzia sp. RIT 804 TaxID=2810209 RepID=UPI0019527E7B|nr:LacI family DNA-binding transcriptional regulator [Desemzia sp. RIT 804]MBM6615335.1 LacI family DNA-binding transcriptional regulator [Desemzia sp. RIT 804]